MGALKKQKVLVVDDENDLVEIYEMELQAAGYDVVKANSGDSAFELLNNTNDVDAVISDVRMPSGDGIQLLDKVRKGKNNELIFILVTGFSDFTNVEALECGASAILKKPARRKKLIKTLQEAFEAKKFIQ